MSCLYESIAIPEVLNVEYVSPLGYKEESILATAMPILILQALREKGFNMALEKELETYRQKLPEWADQVGSFILISGEEILGSWGTYEDAIQEGYRICRLERPFLVKKIEAVESVNFNSRFVQCQP
jgi:hypothetical protein